MASLKEIMNFDEDSLDVNHAGAAAVKREGVSAPRFHGAADSIHPKSSFVPSAAAATATATQTATTLSSSPQGGTRATSIHRQRSLAHKHKTASPSPGPPRSSSSAPNERRSSNTSSTDSMDPAFYGYHQAPQAVDGQPRSYTSASGENPVKLTPITGRVSRAKKGVPVHYCELCQPPKVSGTSCFPPCRYRTGQKGAPSRYILDADVPGYYERPSPEQNI